MVSISEGIWADDQFGVRAKEAADIIDFVNRFATRSKQLNSGGALTLSIDGAYGEGKTYFLERLAKSFEENESAVAFVDAWKDDLSDKPLFAIVATIKLAIMPTIAGKGPESVVKKNLNEFLKNAKGIGKIAAIGAAKRGAAALITAGAVEEISEYVSLGSEQVQDKIGDQIADSAVAGVQGIFQYFEKNDGFINDGVKNFEIGKSAVEEFKTSLKNVISSMNKPLVIIIDELDRCRPSYAIKMLEEIKHLCDIPGIVFIFGVNSDALAKSMHGMYGAAFDSKAYLKRFFNRRYALRAPSTLNYVQNVFAQKAIGRDAFLVPNVNKDGLAAPCTLDELVALYCDFFAVGPRYIVEIADFLETASAFFNGTTFYAPYLVFLIIDRIFPEKELRQPGLVGPDWKFEIQDREGRPRFVGIYEIFDICRSCYWQNHQQVENVRDPDSVQRMAIHRVIHSNGEYDKLSMYGNLLDRVAIMAN